jgi:hypothetical protein
MEEENSSQIELEPVEQFTGSFLSPLMIPIHEPKG